MPDYNFAPEYDPPIWQRRVAFATAREEAELLRLPSLYVRFYKSLPNSPKYRGWAPWVDDNIAFQSWYICLVTDQLRDEDDVKCVVSHEARHMWQWKNSMYTEPDQREKDADEYVFKRHHLVYKRRGYL